MLFRNGLLIAKDRYFLALGLNLILSLLFLITIQGVFVSTATSYTTNARLTEVFTKVTVFKGEIMADYVYLGDWPKSRILEINSKDDYNYIREVVFDGNGVINFFFKENDPELSNKKLSFVAARSLQSEFNAVIWVCGYSLPPGGLKRVGVNITDIEQKYLPLVCK